jgi:6-phosphofructokinase 1
MGKTGVMVSLNPPTVEYVPIENIAGGMRTVQFDLDTITTARDLGICFGD